MRCRALVCSVFSVEVKKEAMATRDLIKRYNRQDKEKRTKD